MLLRVAVAVCSSDDSHWSLIAAPSKNTQVSVPGVLALASAHSAGVEALLQHDMTF